MPGFYLVFFSPLSVSGSTLEPFPRAAVTKHHKQRGLKQEKYIISQLWTPEVQGQGGGRGSSLLKPTEETFSPPF